MSLVNVRAYASASITTNAYSEIFASAPTSVSKMLVCDTSGQILIIAIGPAGEEVDIATTFINGCVLIPSFIKEGTRISMKAVTGNATTGYNTFSLVP